MTRTVGLRTLGAFALVAGVAVPLITPAGAAAATPDLCGPPADTVPPQATGVTITPGSVDVTSTSQPVTVTVDASDTSGSGDASGVRVVSVGIRGAGRYLNARAKLTTGTPTDGTWTATVTVPARSKAGTYSLSSVDVVDADGNSQQYGHYGKTVRSPTDIALQPGWQTQVAVSSQPAPPHRPPRAGRLVGLSFSRRSVNTTSGNRRVQVSAEFSGIPPTAGFVELTGGRRYYNARLRPSVEGTLTGHFMISEWSGTEKLAARLFANYGEDVRPRFRDYTAAQLGALDFQSGLRVVGRVDTTPPQVTGLTVSPSAVDTNAAAAQVTVTAQVSDNASGARSVTAEFVTRSDGHFANFADRLAHGSGNSWSGTVTVPRCIQSGTYTGQIQTEDVAGNGRYYSSKTLQAAGYPATVQVSSSHGDIDPPFVRNSTASVADGTITVNFTEGVHGVTPQTLSVFALSPAAQRYRQATPITGIVCFDALGSSPQTPVDCSDSGQPVTSAVLTIDGGLAGGATYQLWANLGAVTAQLTDMNGNPMAWQWEQAEVTGS